MAIEVCNDASPAVVWSQYVCRRRPCVFKSIPRDLQILKDLVARESLSNLSGEESVTVESRAADGRAFGNGRKVQRTVAEVLDDLHRGSEELYLSTQEAPLQPDGFPALLTPPLRRLVQHGLPLKPAVTGNLVPQAINLWMGRSAEGTSSGLHHDFHDNLYVLLRGTKRFRLFPPNMADRMYTHGSVECIHNNGRIVYKGAGDVMEDGADAADVLRWQLKQRADGAAGVDAASSGNDDEARVEAALEAALAAVGGDDCSDEGSMPSADDSEGEQELFTGSWARASPDEDEQELAAGGVSLAVEAERCDGATADDAAPDSFSQVDMALPEEELRRRFPRFPGAAAATEVTLHAGEMLLLPASWFHEVTSTSGAAEGPHAAVNYWFHPPDALEAHAGGEAGRFPYSSDYWPDMWNARVARCGWDAALAVPLRGDGGAAGDASGKRKQPDA
eukprot:jgi/Ulvmu1/7688/UM038_0120.1